MLYLVPTPIAVGGGSTKEIIEVIAKCDFFVVENIRTARRFIASLKLGITIDELEIVEFSEHSSDFDVEGIIEVLKGGRSGVIMSEAGVPCVADPGAKVVEAAHRAGIRVVPLVGPSSIILALMASGAGGQNFAFNGYLPIKNEQRSRAIKRFENRAKEEKQTQIFIETPYRNASLFNEMVRTLKEGTMLAVACDITGQDELIVCRSVGQWRKASAPAIEKRPTIFIIY